MTSLTPRHLAIIKRVLVDHAVPDLARRSLDGNITVNRCRVVRSSELISAATWWARARVGRAKQKGEAELPDDDDKDEEVREVTGREVSN